MAHYTFRIHQGAHSSDVPVDLPDDDVAWDEAAGACSDMICDTMERLRDGDQEWQLEVADGRVRDEAKRSCAKALELRPNFRT
jgi:hypothetical protein